ncbi:baculoviral IAP repeat-containing protein 7-B-like isoform X3 [Myzus persicae]|uniref:baculoviral IAP repeat-containing protein 7-B-like isoform X3 n=1 Tax=Myzus persicae TaxID=13164 RepID=UPI000B92FAE4|nr:baculoviral IAP repeat-containing protein 7-B-like isoform X3 [Myzus persicae]
MTVKWRSGYNNKSFNLFTSMESSQSIDLKNESNRLSTFAGWPVSFIISPKSLAAAGFYYTKQTDKVKCAFCNICICHWEFGDNAVDEHKRHNPDCSFILSQDCGNIPIIEGIQLRGEFVENHKETGEPIDIQGLGVRAHRVAFHLKYNSFSARLSSFRGWNNESQKPEDLATAGFFFTGSNDEVRCYYCDGGLQNWEVADNSWVEHAKWFPNCGFLNLVKGEKFLDGSLVERFNALLSRPRPDDSTEGQVVSIHQTDNISPYNMSSSTRSNETTDRQISDLMLLPPALMALELGLQPSQIRQAIRSNLQDIGTPFRSMDSFMQQVLNQDQNSFFSDGDTLTLEQILQREGPVDRTGVTQHLSNALLSEESSESNESDEDSNFVLQSDLEDELISEPQDQNITNSQNESDTLDINESAFIADNVHSSQSNDTKTKEEVNLPSDESGSGSIKLSHSDLEEENRRLKEARLCKICLDQELGVVMLPCAHLVACITCASSLPDCPLCRQTIKATVRTFLS